MGAKYHINQLNKSQLKLKQYRQYWSQARIQRGAQGARPWEIFVARFARRRGTMGGVVGMMHPSRKKISGSVPDWSVKMLRPVG